MGDEFVPFGRDVWDISECLDGDGLPRVKRKIVCPACGAEFDKLWWKEWRVFKRKMGDGSMQYRMDISIKCEECALVTGQDRVCMTHNDVAFGVHLTEEEYKKFEERNKLFYDHTMLGGKHVKLSELYIGDEK